MDKNHEKLLIFENLRKSFPTCFDPDAGS